MTKKLMVATPMYGGLCYGSFMNSVLSLSTYCAEHEIPFKFISIGNESLITRARNVLVNMFLENDEFFTHLLFLDSDVSFYDPKHIIDMIDADKDIICGIYPKKSINWKNVESAVHAGIPSEELPTFGGYPIHNNSEQTVFIDENTPIEIASSGTGCMLIKRTVFEQLANFVPYFIDRKTNRKVYTYFDTSHTDDHEYLSEDYHFCTEWKKHCDGKIFAAPWVVLDHTGTYIYSGEFSKVTPSNQQRKLLNYG